IFARFLRFGLLAWGGPVAQIGMIRQELVEEEKWISKERFNRVLGMYQALPGPEAHELCVYFGMVAGGRLGGFLAGLGFMLPGFALMFALSWLYLTHGMSIPFFRPIFHGFQAAVGALIIRAIHRIGSHALTDGWLWGAAGLGALGEALGLSFLLTIPLPGLAYFFVKRGMKLPAFAVVLAFLTCGVVAWNVAGVEAVQPAAGTGNPASLAEIFLSGLRSGSLTFGGAYTVIGFLQHDAVNVQGWLTNEQFLDGLALSGILPAPLIIFATFVGFAAGGAWGALTMTVGIFLPAFSFTLIGHRFLEKIIENENLHALLEGVTASVIGLMAVTSVKLLHAGLDDLPSVFIFVPVLAVLYLWNSRLAVPAVMAASAVMGLLFYA
ncbi:MAG: chromate efflux transporter, partial [Acidobacteriota bacterium]